MLHIVSSHWTEVLPWWSVLPHHTSVTSFMLMFKALTCKKQIHKSSLRQNGHPPRAFWHHVWELSCHDGLEPSCQSGSVFPSVIILPLFTAAATTSLPLRGKTQVFNANHHLIIMDPTEALKPSGELNYSKWNEWASLCELDTSRVCEMFVWDDDW